MTTTIKVTSHNYPAKVAILDNGKEAGTEILTPEDGERVFYCTTTRELRITDLEYDNEAVLAHKARQAQAAGGA